MPKRRPYLKNIKSPDSAALLDNCSRDHKQLPLTNIHCLCSINLVSDNFLNEGTHARNDSGLNNDLFSLHELKIYEVVGRVLKILYQINTVSVLWEPTVL